MLENAKWISAEGFSGCPQFVRRFNVCSKPVSARLTITALGVYVAQINGKRVGDFVLAPGWTVYRKRVQVQEYDVTELIKDENEISVVLGSGWYCGEISRQSKPEDNGEVLLAELSVTMENGETCVICTDEAWSVCESKIRYSDIYNGETYDAGFVGAEQAVIVREISKDILIPQQGEKIVLMDELYPVELIKTPAGENVLDFGQEITGIVRMHVDAPAGTQIRITCAEVFDADGNFYTENYREAKSEMNYISDGSEQWWEPALTFYGFRYIRVEGIDPRLEDFRAVVMCSDIKRVGRLDSGVQKLNRLFDNIIWGQKGNFVDVPTDCPQRDERLGWTGDAQVFINTACWQFELKKFYTKWLEDMKLDQRENGAIPCVVPNVLDHIAKKEIKASTAWGDAAAVCPWSVYRHYGDKELLRTHFEMMKKWVDFITSVTDTPSLWTGYDKRQGHFGDWLGLDANEGSYVGATDTDLIASAFYYYSNGLLIKAGKVLGEDMSEYEALHENTRKAFREYFTEYKTQTACVLAIYFDLAADIPATTEKLAKMVHENGDCLTTGFVGTPYLLYALSQNGYTDLAYSLLLQEKFPSWLYSVNQGATTIWEHWDGKKPDGNFWSKDMNSFNHYAYGSVAGWVFEEAAGITPLEPGFTKVSFAPKPDARLGWLRAEHDTAYGKIVSAWRYNGDKVSYEFVTPVEAEITVNGKTYKVAPGSYLF